MRGLQGDGEVAEMCQLAQVGAVLSCSPGMGRGIKEHKPPFLISLRVRVQESSSPTYAIHLDRCMLLKSGNKILKDAGFHSKFDSVALIAR